MTTKADLFVDELMANVRRGDGAFVALQEAVRVVDNGDDEMPPLKRPARVTLKKRVLKKAAK